MPDAGTDYAVRTARIVAEHGALRRVATLVARRVSQDDLFAAVNEEIARLVGADAAALMRSSRTTPSRSSPRGARRARAFP